MTKQLYLCNRQVPDPEHTELVKQLRRCHNEYNFLSEDLSGILHYNESLRSTYPSQYSNTAAEEAKFQAENSIFRKGTSDAFFEGYGRAHSKLKMEQLIKDVKEEIEDLKKLIEIWREENIMIRRGESDVFGDPEDARRQDSGYENGRRAEL